jgi:hypothetical protein
MAGVQLPPDQPERRRSSRTDIYSDFRGEVMVFQTVTVRQINHTGLRVDTTVPLQIDSLHDIRLSLAAASVVVKTRVVHCTVSDMESQSVSYEAGLEFVQPNAAVRLAIAQFIDALKSAEWRNSPPPLEPI